MQATPASTIAYDEAAPAKLFTKARAQLRENGVPSGAPLVAAVGSNVYGALYDALPANGTVFDANGRMRGFDVHESTALDADEASSP